MNAVLLIAGLSLVVKSREPSRQAFQLRLPRLSTLTGNFTGSRLWTHQVSYESSVGLHHGCSMKFPVCSATFEFKAKLPPAVLSAFSTASEKQNIFDDNVGGGKFREPLLHRELVKVEESQSWSCHLLSKMASDGVP